MHPQGGGQPSDTGTLSSSDGKTLFSVSMVSKDTEGAISHIGSFTKGKSFNRGDNVGVVIDEDNRRMFARLHRFATISDCGFQLNPFYPHFTHYSAGHLLDAAMEVKNLFFFSFFAHVCIQPFNGTWNHRPVL